jgi:acyl-CoA-binding protein
MSVEAEFAEAQERAKKLSRRPGNEDLLRLYSLFKQATAGDASGKRPGLLDPVGRAKHDAWTSRKGMDRVAAMQAYVELVQALEQRGG